MSFQDMEETSLSSLLMAHNPLAQSAISDFTNVLYDSDETDIDKILQILMHQYVQEKEKLNNLRLQLQLSLQSHEPSEDIKRIVILKAEEQKLDQEIEQQILGQRKAKIKSRIFCDLWVRKHISDTVEQCRDFLPKLRQEMQDTKDHIIREKETLNETNIIHEVLSERIERQSDVHLSRESENWELNDVKRSYNTLTKELVKFVDTHFPPHKLVRKEFIPFSPRSKSKQIDGITNNTPTNPPESYPPKNGYENNRQLI
ncbi:12763_t:CDS:2 [Dentiscutata erythropus]|uniref:12763_t:CDS:1 n=1 Tax=Dentiscutata erythropus TaxID=1348616 RepID=A0A9N9FTJ7_9GLOM|nr:12763_t:CDS:2 [Dentiscutata erythropus]